MTINNFAKNMRRMGQRKTQRARKPIEIIDDVVTIGQEPKQWSKTERNGRTYLTRT